jgi:hypothetical protein
VDPEISKLLAAIVELVTALKDKAGLPASEEASEATDDRFDPKKEKVADKEDFTLSAPEAQKWEGISKIFARTFSATMKGPDFGAEAPTANVPTIISNSAPQPDNEKPESMFSKILSLIGPAIALIGALGLGIAALFTGPGVMGDALKMAAKLSGQGFKLMLSTIGKKIGSKLLKVARYIPFIGAGVSLYFAYKRFSSGDIIGGGMEVISALLEFIPGAGFILSSAMDILILARDLTMTDEEKLKQNSSFGIVGTLKTIGKWVSDKLGKNARYLPVIGSFINISEALGKIKGGNVKGGVTSLLQSIFPFLPGFGEGMMRAWDFITGLFGSSDKESEPGAPATSSNFMNNIKTAIKNKLSNLPWFIRKPLEWMGILDKTVDAPTNVSVPDFSEMYKITSVALTAFKDANMKAFNQLASMSTSAFEWLTTNSKPMWEKFKEVNLKAIQDISDVNSTAINNVVDSMKAVPDASSAAAATPTNVSVPDFSEMYKITSGALTAFKDANMKAFNQLTSMPTSALLTAFKDANMKAFNQLASMPTSAFEWLTTNSKPMWEKFKEVNLKAIQDISDVNSSAFTWIKDKVPGMWDKFKAVNSTAINNVVDSMKAGWDASSAAAAKASESLSGTIPSVYDNVISVHKHAIDTIKEAADGLIETIQNIKLPDFAQAEGKNIIIKSEESVVLLKNLGVIGNTTNQILGNILTSINKIESRSPSPAADIPAYNKSSAATGVFYHEEQSILNTK